jgi:hypothetical protein
MEENHMPTTALKKLRLAQWKIQANKPSSYSFSTVITQFACIKGRFILESVASAHEIIHSIVE